MSNGFCAYCGLYCENCFQRKSIGPLAKQLRENMRRIGYEKFGPLIPDFQAFWGFLSNIADDNGCRGCGVGGGNPYCEIRICAKENCVEHCALCEAYPCSKFDAAIQAYPMIEADNQYLRENGREAWLQMQQMRMAQNYSYTEALAQSTKSAE